MRFNGHYGTHTPGEVRGSGGGDVSDQPSIATQWIENVSYRDATVSVRLTRQAVKDAPPYEPAVKLDRKQDVEIHKHDGRSGYRAREAIPEAAASPHQESS